MKPKFNDNHKPKEMGNVERRRDTQAGKVTRRAFTEASKLPPKEKVSANIKRNIGEINYNNLTKWLADQGKVIDSNSQPSDNSTIEVFQEAYKDTEKKYYNIKIDKLKIKIDKLREDIDKKISDYNDIKRTMEETLEAEINNIVIKPDYTQESIYYKTKEVREAFVFTRLRQLKKTSKTLKLYIDDINNLSHILEQRDDIPSKVEITTLDEKLRKAESEQTFIKQESLRIFREDPVLIPTYEKENTIVAQAAREVRDTHHLIPLSNSPHESNLAMKAEENVEEEGTKRKDCDTSDKKAAFKMLDTDKPLEIHLENPEVQLHWWQKPGVFDSATDDLDFERDLKPVLSKLSYSQTTYKEFQIWREIGRCLYQGKKLSDEQNQRLLKQKFEDAQWAYKKAKQNKPFKKSEQQINSESYCSELNIQSLQQESEDCEQRYIEALRKANGTTVPDDKTHFYDPDLTKDILKWSDWLEPYITIENIEELWSQFVQHKEKNNKNIIQAFFHDLRKFARYWAQSDGNEQIPKDLRDAIKHKFQYFEKCHQYARREESKKAQFEDAKQKITSANYTLTHINELKSTSQRMSSQAENEIHDELQQHPSRQTQDNTLQNRTVDRIKTDYYTSIDLADNKNLQNCFKFNIGVANIYRRLHGLGHTEFSDITVKEMRETFEEQKKLYHEYKKWKSAAFESRQGALELRRELYKRYDEKEERYKYKDISLKGGLDVGQEIFEHVKEVVKPELEKDLQPLRDHQNTLNKKFKEFKDMNGNQSVLKTLEKIGNFMDSALIAQEKVYQFLLQANSYIEELIIHQQEVGQSLSTYKEQLRVYKEKWQIPTFETNHLEEKISKIIKKYLSQAKLEEKDQLLIEEYFSNQWKQKVVIPSYIERTDSIGKDTLGRLKKDALDNITNSIVLDIYKLKFRELKIPIQAARKFYLERAEALQELRAIHKEVQSNIQDLQENTNR